MNNDDRTKLIDHTLELLSKARANRRGRNRDGEMSMSYLMDELRYRGWRLTNSAEMENVFEALGFTTRRVFDKNGNIRCTLIGLEG